MTVYWMTTYTEVRDPQRIAEYAALGAPALEAAGGTFLARGEPVAVLEGDAAPRMTLIAFDDLDTAVAAYRSPGYQKALAALGDAAVRDIRIMPGA